MAALRVGDAFFITGPPDRNGLPSWWAGKRGGWQPRAWSSHPDDPASELLKTDDMYVDFARRFVVHELHHSERFVSARVQVGPYGANGRDVWLNVAKDGTDWVWQPRSA